MADFVARFFAKKQPRTVAPGRAVLKVQHMLLSGPWNGPPDLCLHQSKPSSQRAQWHQRTPSEYIMDSCQFLNLRALRYPFCPLAVFTNVLFETHEWRLRILGPEHKQEADVVIGRGDFLQH